MISVIVPAFNEEVWLPATLESIRAAADYLRARSEVGVEVIVVDNNSTDGTAAVARDTWARPWFTSLYRALAKRATPERARPRATCWSSSMRTFSFRARSSRPFTPP